MCEERDVSDCVDEAKEAVAESLEGGANYLRRYGADDLVSTAIHEAADDAVPTTTTVLLQVFSNSSELWYSQPECGFDNSGGGIVSAIARVLYASINTALYEWANDLEGDTLVCEADECESMDDHEPCANENHCVACLADTDVLRCTAHCGGVGACERCAVALIEEARND